MKMKLIKGIALVMITAMIMTSLPVNMLTAQAEQTIESAAASVKSVSDNDVEDESNVLSGTFGDNGGFTWRYDENTRAMVVTGEDSGLNSLKESCGSSVYIYAIKVVFQDCVVSGSMSGLLSQMWNVTTVEFNNVDTGNVSDMSNMFLNCWNLAKVDVSGFNTGNVTDMSGMFSNCWILSNVNISNFNTASVTDMSNMFANSNLTQVDISNFTTENVTDMSGMFSDCSSLTSVDVSNFTTENVTDMSNMFSDCSSLTSVDISNFITENVTDMSGMFTGCSGLTSVDVSSFTAENVTDMSGMFSGCSGLTSVDVSSFTTENVTDMSGMFSGCSGLTTVDVSNFTTENVTDMSGMFSGCSSLTTVDLSGLDTGNAIYGEVVSDDGENVAGSLYMFAGCNNLETIKTPTSVNDVGIWLPYVFYDLKNNETKTITSDYCNTILNKEGGPYTIKFDGNGATSGRMSDLANRKYGKSYNLAANAFQKTGYKFNGWNTQKSGKGKTYKDKASVKNLTVVNGGTVTLYAQWKAIPYTITYKLNGGINNKSNPVTYTVVSDTALKQPTRTGYTFAGWFSDSKYKTKVNKITRGSTGNIVLHAQWTPNKYTIKFDKNGGTGGKMNAMKGCKYGTGYTLTKNNFKRKGYTFTGWNTKKNGKGKNYKNQASVNSLLTQNGSSITLYAQWKKESYKITYKLNGGKNKTSNPKKYTVTTKNINLKAPTKKGYTFKGWYKDKKFKKKVTQIKKGSTGNITLYAKWKKNK